MSKMIVLALALVCATSFAGTASSTMVVTIAVDSNCSVTANPLAFPDYNPIAATDLSATGSLTIACTRNTAANVQLGQGANPASGSSDSNPLRQFANGTNRLGYSIWQDAPHTLVWGNTPASSHPYNGTGATDTLVVYGVVRALQAVPPGNYSDSVIATVNF